MMAPWGGGAVMAGTRPTAAWPTRMALAMALVLLVDAAALALLALLGVPIVVVAAAGAAFLAVQLLLGPALSLALFGAHPASAGDEPQLHALVERLCQLGDLRKPRIAIAELDAPAAFTVGHGGASATLCLSRGLLEQLPQDELTGVLAHELAHVASRDAVVMSVASLVPTVAGLCLRVAFWDGIPDRATEGLHADTVRGGALMIGTLVLFLATALLMVALRVVLLVPLAVALLLTALTLPAVAALSRYRELAADRSAALLTGSPAALASALVRLSGAMGEIPRQDLRRVALANALLVMPAGLGLPGLERLTATHPPVEERVRRLLALAGSAAT
jgi:heat shock protein HtpX